MTGMSEVYQAHVQSGLTTLCRCWAITRKDGEILGFTDHDCPISFEGIVFKANSGLSAVALQQSTGLSVDNTEAVGALSDASVREADINAGLYDGADVRSWRVNWQDPSIRWLQFRGSIGEVRRGGGAFEAELRGLTEALNRPIGRVFQKPCTAVLGDRNCGFDPRAPGYEVEIEGLRIFGNQRFEWDALEGFEPGWFTRGRLDVVSGAATGLWGTVKRDSLNDGVRVIELWEPIRAKVGVSDRIRLRAGCDKHFDTCRLKFNNALNFQGFPDIPGEDWMMSVPKKTGRNSGGSLR